jgi:hypothetical protein
MNVKFKITQHTIKHLKFKINTVTTIRNILRSKYSSIYILYLFKHLKKPNIRAPAPNILSDNEVPLYTPI